MHITMDGIIAENYMMKASLQNCFVLPQKLSFMVALGIFGW